MPRRQIVFAVPRPKAERLSAQRLEAICAAMRPAEVRLLVLDTPAGIGDRLRREAPGADAVAIGAGDGTINAAIEALMDLGLPLLIVPLGTANDLARTLGVPLDPVEAAGWASRGEVRAIDVGRVNGTAFFNVANLGLGVAVARRLANRRKRFGVFSYLVALADVWRATRSFRVWIGCDEETVTMRTIQVSVGNGRYHGGGIAVAEDATIDDGRLDVYALEPQPFWRLMGMLPAMFRGRHRHWRTVTALRGERVRVDTRKPMDINVDGEVRARTPARFEVVRGGVNVLVRPDARLAAAGADDPSRKRETAYNASA